ncbi:unnamed protein product [Mycena citricolor]|uniref:Peptidase M1 leukotriene A4 hydrolase/aminopeptidase C-terminal domain-containing protein n=1 Tax=Mycena citricolor TaxID=2018698 RepID=A0AAD2GUM0_9AGAR|nr:unnamed protein product [Mycena citricolor]
MSPLSHLTSTMSDLDPTTESNYQDVSSEHVSIFWNVDFKTQIIAGSVTHRMNVLGDNVSEAIFDTSDLEISQVAVNGDSATYNLKPKHSVMGSALHVLLPSGLRPGAKIEVSIAYKTSPENTALQWLDPEQTQGKQFPYLFSQCQPIYARALLPVQDTPSVKITYAAEVTAVLPVLLSAIRVSPPSDGPAHDGKVIGEDAVTYRYSQPVPIPSYLIAIASGNVRYRPFASLPERAWTSGVWAEPELMDASFWEFSEHTAKWVTAIGNHIWHFPNAIADSSRPPRILWCPTNLVFLICLSFRRLFLMAEWKTPLLAGDRTLVDVVAHELAHSWFGNGVTHAHASHFWLNEGWTVWMERLLLQYIHKSPAARGFSYIIGAKALADDLKLHQDQPRYQRLVIPFTRGEDPDDSYSRVPYDKGATLLLHLEQTLGGLDVFLPYVKDYVSTFVGSSITTEQWKDHLYGFFAKQGDKIELLDTVDWDAWLNGEGTKLPVELTFDQTLAQAAYALADRWAASDDLSQFVQADLGGFSSTQKIVFLERLQGLGPLSKEHIIQIGAVYGLAETLNAEIRLRFYGLALSPATPEAALYYVKAAANWVIGADGTGVIKGRMKFCRPVLRSVHRIDPEMAMEIWSANKHSFHPIARRLVDKDLGLFESD